MRWLKWRERWLRASVSAEVRRSVEQDAAVTRLPFRVGSAEVELIALAAGLKPVVRQWVSPDDQGRLERSLPPGCLIENTTTHEGRRLAFLGRDAAALKEAVRTEATFDDRALGLLLGYPACCVDAFVNQPDTPNQRERTELKLARATWARTRRPRARLNNLDMRLFHWVSWTPCSFDCEASLAWVARAADAFVAMDVTGAARDAGRRAAALDFVAQVDALLAAHRVLWAGAQVSVLGERTSDGRLTVQAAWPTWRDHPSGGVPPELKDRAVTVAAALLARREVRLSGAELFSFER